MCGEVFINDLLKQVYNFLPDFFLEADWQLMEDLVRSMWHNSLHSLKRWTISFKEDKDNLVDREKGGVPRLVADMGIFSIM